MNILYLTFYFEPDLCAGSFRNTPLAMELSKQCGEDCHIDVVTTQPNRYSSFKVEAKTREDIGNMSIHRIDLPSHKVVCWIRYTHSDVILQSIKDYKKRKV